MSSPVLPPGQLLLALHTAPGPQPGVPATTAAGLPLGAPAVAALPPTSPTARQARTRLRSPLPAPGPTLHPALSMLPLPASAHRPPRPTNRRPGMVDTVATVDMVPRLRLPRRQVATPRRPLAMARPRRRRLVVAMMMATLRGV